MRVAAVFITVHSIRTHIVPYRTINGKKRYPASPDDNQYHLQALRHLYVLAVQRRGIDAVDVDTGESLFVPVSVTLRESSPRHRSGKRRAAATAAPSPAPATGGHGAAAAAAVAEAKEEASGTLSMVTPCILPDLKKVSRLAVRSPRYFPVELDIAGNPALASALRRNCRIYVKRRVGHLSYKNVRGIRTGGTNQSHDRSVGIVDWCR